MLTATRSIAEGSLQLRAMTSTAALVVGGDGLPLLLQTGGSYRRGYIHDRQHPHDLVMELAIAYDRRLVGGVGFSLYGGAVGNPALGPPSYMHRPSAENDPAAPLGHHWQDASHGSYGVVTAGLNARSLVLEGSAFNARESDYAKPWPDFTGARLDSYAGRLRWSTSRVGAAAWWGYISTHDPLAPLTPMHRYGASVTTRLRGIRGGRWSSSAIWGMNVHHHGGTSHALLHGDPNASPHHHASSLLAESSLEIGSRHAIFTRAERVMKNGEELGFLGGDLTALYDLRALAAGYRRTIRAIGQADLGIGGRATVNFVPESLLLTYGTRQPKGLAAYLDLRRR